VILKNRRVAQVAQNSNPRPSFASLGMVRGAGLPPVPRSFSSPKPKVKLMPSHNPRPPPISARDEVEAIHRQAAAAARPPLQPEPRPDAPGTDVSFQPTDAPISTPQMLFDAIQTSNVELLTRAARHRNRRRHPLQAP
jgi:hypothetical protein